MGILARYVIAEFLKMLLPVWGALGFLLFILELFSQIFRIEGVPASTIIWMYFLKTPMHLHICFPVAVLFCALSVMGQMNRNREIVAAQSLGVRPRQLMWAAVTALALVIGPYYWVVNTLAPAALKKHLELYDTQVEKRPSRFSVVRNEKIWFRNKDVLYNVGYFDHQKSELFDLTIYTFDDDFHIAQVIRAQRAAWDGQGWTLHKGKVVVTDKRLEAPATEFFTQRPTQLIEAPASLKRVEQGAETMTQKELLRFIRRNRELGVNTAQWEVIYHSRLSFFLVALAFLALAFPMSMRFERGGSRAKDGTFVALVSMLYWLIFNFSINYANAGKLDPAMAAWAPSLLFLFLVALFYRGRNIFASR